MKGLTSLRETPLNKAGNEPEEGQRWILVLSCSGFLPSVTKLFPYETTPKQPEKVDSIVKP